MRPIGEELDLHRLTVDEALPKLDEFLHAAYQAGLYRVRVVHGKGNKNTIPSDFNSDYGKGYRVYIYGNHYFSNLL